jgi:hypothetical protein
MIAQKPGFGKKEFPDRQWEKMPADKYGWSEVREMPKEVAQALETLEEELERYTEPETQKPNENNQNRSRRRRKTV